MSAFKTCLLSFSYLIMCTLLSGCSSVPSQLKLGDYTAPPWQLIHSVNVITMEDKAVRQNQHVLVHNGKITAIGAANTLALPNTNIERIDGQNGYLIPGITDMHVHLFDYPDLAANLAFGVTRVRNTGGIPWNLTVLEQQANNQLLAPEVITSGPIVNEIDGRNSNPLQVQIDNPIAAREVVRKQHAQGYNSIKIYSNLARENVKAIMDEALKLDMPVFGHPQEGKPPAHMPFTESLGLGMQTIEHMESIVYHTLDEEIDTEGLREVARQLAKTKNVVTPTLIVHHNLTQITATRGRHITRPDMEGFNPFIKFIESSKYDYWAQYEYDDRIKLQQFYNQGARIFYEEGVNMVMGSDAGVMVSPAGISSIEELMLLQQAGIPNWDVLAMATRNAAEVLGKTKTSGTITPGKIASMVLAQENPLQNLETLKRPLAVMVNGYWLDQEDLQHLKNYSKDTSFLRTAWHGVESIFSK